jgi:hypothetical protein
MTAEFDHLAPEFREEAALSSSERIRRIQAERWIGYAATGMGKTKILRKFRREHPAAFDDRAGISGCRWWPCKCHPNQMRNPSTPSYSPP